MNDCAITVLHAKNRRTPGQAHPSPTTEGTTGYDGPRPSTLREVGCRGLDHLAGHPALPCSPCWSHCVVRGIAEPAASPRPAASADLLHTRTRKTGDQPTLYEVPRRHVAIDVDGDAIARPPEEFPATDVAGCARIAISQGCPPGSTAAPVHRGRHRQPRPEAGHPPPSLVLA